MVGIFSGDVQPEPTLLQSIQAAESTSFLFIAAGTNETEIAYNSLFHQAVSERSRLWIIPNVGHTSGFGSDPAQYEQQVVDFFNSVLVKP